VKIRTFESIEELKHHFGFQKDGIIVERDIDLVESECDFNERKRRDAEVLCTLAANSTGPFLDIGTSHGRSAAELASNVKNNIVYTINLLPDQIIDDEKFITHLLTKEEIGSYYRELKLNNIEQIYANTSTWDVPDKIKELSMVFVDGNHDTNAVYSDTNLIFDRVKCGGFILWHDFSPPLRSKYQWIDSVMKGAENFLADKSPDIEVFHLKNSWIGFIRKHSDRAALHCSQEVSSTSSTTDLADKKYWNSKHAPPFSPWQVNSMLFSSILESYLPVDPSLTCAEIGAYPGSNLCFLAKRFHYKPVAIEFSDYCNNIRSLFKHNGINNYEIINKDFFSISNTQYDVVTSFGFIEHFDDYSNAIKKHFDLLKPGGYLVISVPRFDGFQGALFELAFDEKVYRDMIAAHNLKITNINQLKHTVSQFTDCILFCDYANDGILYYDWNHPNLKDDKRWLIYFVNRLSGMMGQSLPTDQFISPHLLLIARKPEHHFTPSAMTISRMLDAASQKLALNDYTATITLLESCIWQFPEYLETYRILANLLMEIGKSAHAERVLLQALKVEPNTRSIYEELIKLYTDTLDSNKLTALFREMSLWHPDISAARPVELNSSLQLPAQGTMIAVQDIPENTASIPMSYPVSVIEQSQNIVTCAANGFTWQLDTTQFVDREILAKGLFEPESTYWVSQIVKPGMTVLDVGANFGYFTVQFSRIVGEKGRVYAFEPSNHFYHRLEEHLKLNKCDNVTALKMGLSDAKQNQELLIDDSTATLYWHDDAKKPVLTETICLDMLDSLIEITPIDRIDFVKIDIDGTEPRFLKGAHKTLEKFKPVLLIEFAQLVLMAAGCDVPTLANQLRSLGYTLYSEKNGQPYTSEAQFLREAMNCSHSVNIICFPSNN
jgi:FkbM family methyltransferase